MKTFFPILLVQFYLIFTLFLLVFGPVKFRIHNEDLFFLAVILYQLALVLGYYIGVRTFKFRPMLGNKILSAKLFYLSLFFAVLSVFLTYRNVMHTSSILPTEIFRDIVRGVYEPGLVYSERMVAGSEIQHGINNYGRILNILSLAFSFCKLLFLFFIFYFWSYWGFFRKFLAVVYCLLFVSVGIASGTNSVIFVFIIFSIISFFVVSFARRQKFLLKAMFCMFGGIFSAVGYFGYTMSQRGGGFNFFSTTSPLGDISAPAEVENINGFLDFYYYAFVWLNYYLTQGYYGFSLVLGLDRHWTFGFGNSLFAQRQFHLLTGIDISNLTLQAQIRDVWGSAQWHSFYGHFANDFGFIGLSIFMIFLGFFLARVWCSVIFNNSFYGLSILPMFFIMFIFFPANNFVFGYIDTISYFLFVSLLWMGERTKIRF